MRSVAIRAVWIVGAAAQVWLYAIGVGTAGMPVLHSHEWHLLFAAVMVRFAFKEADSE